MRSATKNSNRGFSLIELLIALAVGVLVLGAAVQLFSKSVTATWLVSQRAELQEDARAASNLLTKDISLAGAGMPSGGIALASGTATAPVYGCSYNGTCYLGAANTAAVKYPTQTVGASTINYMYGVIPGCQAGITVSALQGPTDTITVVYADNAFLLSDYTVTLNATGTQATFTLPSPAPNPLDQPVDSTAVGLQAGDLVLFQTKLGSGTGTTTGYAVGEVTNPLPTGTGPSYTVNFTTADPLQFNQSTATSGDMKQIAAGTGTIGTRIWVTTYYLKILPDPLGVGAGTPVLMRQVNGRTPVPVAENVVNLQFTYDTYDTSGNLLHATCDGGESLGVSPNLIRTINIAHLTLRSQMAGGNMVVQNVKPNLASGALTGYQGYDVQTSISARNLSFSQRYQ
ncbi:MAG: prepilin-type N-terminal cleavage/methylation domain-containing protein [Terriglobales bacterium]